MENMKLLFIISLCITGSFLFEIDDHSPDQIVQEGEAISLFCHTTSKVIDGNDNWKTCRWSRDKDGATCLYEYQVSQNGIDWEVKEYCEPFLSDVKFFGEDLNIQNNLCGINISSSNQFDNGNWTCWMEECRRVSLGGCADKVGNGNRVKATVAVEVKQLYK